MHTNVACASLTRQVPDATIQEIIIFLSSQEIKDTSRQLINLLPIEVVSIFVQVIIISNKHTRDMVL